LEALKSLKKLMLGGEALAAELAKELRRELPAVLLNMYGPTETTIWSTTHRLDEVSSIVLIGRPIANTQIHILNGNLQPVPVGVTGELFIGGEGVARGYLNRPELTDEKFISDLFSNNSNARLYRTGDRARYREDGEIEFLGRVDQQIKLRGHRIEAGEIESVLRESKGVRECVVVSREVTTGDLRLIAYIVAEAETEANDLRQFLQRKLPDFMVPAAFVFLDQLPLTPNRKIDRKALPAPSEFVADRQTAYVAPRTETEKKIAKLWQELLRVGTVGLHDNFFDLGGHSLLVVQAQARLQDLTGVNVSVVRLFQFPTVGALAKFIGNGEGRASLNRARNRGSRQRAAYSETRQLQTVS
jgi:acyl carrier protein